MAKGTSAIGKFRGKMGSVVYRVVDGKQVMQEYNPHPAESKTVPQQCQRMGMTLLSKLGSSCLSAIKMGFSANSYPFSKFIKRNLTNTIVSGNTPGSVEINWGQVIFAEDTLHHNNQIQVQSSDWGNSVHLTVKVEFGLTADVTVANWKVYMLLYNPDWGTSILSPSVMGSATSITCVVPSNWDGQQVHAWLIAADTVGAIDPDAVNDSSPRLPTYTTASFYIGSGDIE